MLPKHSRLTKQTIENHLIGARRIQTSRFLVLYTAIPGLSGPQISFIASKKVSPKAVLRNKLRRRGYSAIRPLIPSFSPTAAVLVSYKNPDTKVSIKEMTEELKSVLEKAKVLVK